jgi:hypothetical protein
MALTLEPKNIVQVISAILPFLITFYLVMSSVINADIKAIIYLLGILGAIFISGLFANVIKSHRSPYAPLFCEMFKLPFYNTQYHIPALNSVILGFTLSYLTIPMRYTNQFNPLLFGFLLVLLLIDGITRVLWLCTTWAGVIFGALIGALLGMAYFSLLHNSGANNLLYFSDSVSNKAVCSRPKKQQFKCNVYKNGELVQSL